MKPLLGFLIGSIIGLAMIALCKTAGPIVKDFVIENEQYLPAVGVMVFFGFIGLISQLDINTNDDEYPPY